MTTICAPIPRIVPRRREKRPAKKSGVRAPRGEAAAFADRPLGLLELRARRLGRASALAGLVAYYASQLPPIDQLAIPKRPPNIAILAVDGTLLANRGDTGGAAVHLSELPPYLPKAFVAIEDRRFYSHFGIDPVGIVARDRRATSPAAAACRAARR